jgi:hypothetical protein
VIEVSTDQLEAAIKGMHGCAATLRGEVPVNEEFDGKPVWEGVISEFAVDHPETSTCYAWSAPIEGSSKRKFYAVLGIPPINSAQDAVRAAIVQEFREKK